MTKRYLLLFALTAIIACNGEQVFPLSQPILRARRAPQMASAGTTRLHGKPLYPAPGFDGSTGSFASNPLAPRYVLFLTADGFRTDYVEWYQPPTIKQLISEGVRVAHATNVFPSVTSPNMASLVTGSYPRTTGIGCNAQYEKERDRIVSHIRNDGAITIAETLHGAGWKTAAVNHFMLQKSVQKYMDAGYDESEKTSDAVLELLKDREIRFIGVIYGNSSSSCSHIFQKPSSVPGCHLRGRNGSIHLVTMMAL